MKLTSDIQRCCGGVVACRGVHSAAILAMVPGPSIGDGQHRAPRTNFSIIYKQQKQQFRCWCQGSYSLCTPNLAVVGYWLFSTPLIPLHLFLLGT